MQPDVITRSFSNQRDGANLFETQMTIARLQNQGIRVKYEVQLLSDARGAEAQALVCYGLTMRDGLSHDVCFVVTMNNDVLAFDLADGSILWQQHIGRPVKSTQADDMWKLQDHWGGLSTPIINRSTNSLVLVAMASSTGQLADAHHMLYVLDLVTGTAQTAVLDLNDAVCPTPKGVPVLRLGDVARKQRPALLFDNRNGVATVFVGFGSFLEDAPTNRGWVLAVDLTAAFGRGQRGNPSIAAVWCATVSGNGGGVWQAGQGLSMDADGYVYGMNGNGDFNGQDNLSECFFKLAYAPKTANAAAQLRSIGHWPPFMDSQRERGAEKPRPANATSNYRNANDQDLGSGGPLLMLRSMTGFSRDILAGAGKDGILYLLDPADIGSPQPADFAPDRIREHVYGKLLVPPYGFTFDGSNMDLAPLDPGDLQTLVNGYTAHQHSCPTAFMSPDHGLIIHTNGENGPVRAFSVWEAAGKFGATYLGCGAEIASAGMPPPGGMPGGMLSLSANGKQDGILWVTQPINGDANRAIVPGRLIAYAASWFRNGQMVKLWSSEDWGINFAFCKFNIPICTGGKIILPTYDGRILVFE